MKGEAVIVRRVDGGSINRRGKWMEALARGLLAVVLLGVAGFAVFGFLATFEPMDAVVQWTWRGVYAAAGLASVAGIGWALWPRRRA
jgi:hypothetical protein